MCFQDFLEIKKLSASIQMKGTIDISLLQIKVDFYFFSS